MDFASQVFILMYEDKETGKTYVDTVFSDRAIAEQKAEMLNEEFKRFYNYWVCVRRFIN